MPEPFKWCCENPECKMQNLAEQAQIDDAVKRRQKLIFVCANCGLVLKFVKKGSPKGANFLSCIPLLEDWPSRIPTGRNADGTYKDFQGKSFDRDTFTTTNGADPEQWLLWRDNGKPKPVHKC